MQHENRRTLFGSFFNFLVAGIANTLITYFLYWLLLKIFPYWISYSLSYVFGIFLAYVLYRYFVFQKISRKWGPLYVIVIYFSQYLLGLGLVFLWVQCLQAAAVFAPIFSIAISLPLTYLLNRWVFQPAV